ERIDQIRSRVRGLELFHGNQRLEGPVMFAGIATAGKDGSTTRELLDAACVAAGQVKALHTQEKR
ncbi:MAG TPA: hypothetical protein VKQ05_03090, partial [Gemmatimonadales bacterium]|nr:hypothetical protein [Gemmatimonadales bacterium]